MAGAACMRLRLLKRGWLAGMIVLILVSVAIWVVWLRLPTLVERRVTDRLIAIGFEEPRLRIPSIGLQHLQLTNLSAVHGPWRIQLEQGAASYGLKDLLRSELRSLDLTGLRIELDPSRFERLPDATHPDLADLRRSALELSGRIPLRSFSVKDGTFHVKDGEREALVFFTIQLTNTVENGSTQFELHGSNAETHIRIVGMVDSQTGAELAIDLEMNNGDAWLDLARTGGRPTQLTELRLGVLSTTIRLQLPPDEKVLLLTGAITGIEAGMGEGRVRVGPTSYQGQWGEAGLSVWTDSSQLNLGHGELRATADVVGMDVELRGGLERIDFAVRKIIVRHEEFGEMWFTELEGRVTALERESVGNLTGQLEVLGSPHLAIPEPIPFGVSAYREAETTGLEARLDFLNTSLRGPQMPEGLALSGEATGAVVLGKNGMAWRTDFNLDFSAPTLELTEGLTVVEPRVRLTRSAAVTGNPTVLVQVQFEAGSIDYQGILVENLQGSGEVSSIAAAVDGPGSVRQPAQGILAEWRPDTAWLRGEATLGEAVFGYEVRVWQAGELRTGLGLAGEFMVGTIPLAGLDIPVELTGGKAVQVTGEVAARGKFRLCPGEEFAWWPVIGLALDQVWYGDHEVTDVRLRMDWTDQQIARVELVQARYLGGEIRAAPFQWDLSGRNFELDLDLEGLKLEQLALHIPQFAGSIEGSLDGRLAIGLEGGEIAIRGGRLELDRERAGRLQYPAEGLLTAGLPAGSDEQRRLALVEDGLKDLRLQGLTVDLYDPEDPETPVKISLEGTSVSERAIVPIQFHLNLRGDVDPLLRWWQSGNFEFDSGQVLEPGR
jgi:hypothetical protein